MPPDDRTANPDLHPPGPAGRRIDISVIMTAHREGLLPLRTLLAARRAIRIAEAAEVTVELIVVLDSADLDTRRFFSEHAHLYDTLLECQLGDAGPSRNFGIRHARGRHVAILDADDLVSGNWLIEAHRFLEASPGAACVLHPELNLYFEERKVLWANLDQRSPDFRIENLFEANPWSVLVFAPKDVFLRVPYVEAHRASGFGYEDWHWNCEAVAAGLEHRIVPGTCLFHRIKAQGGRLRFHLENHTLLPATRLLDLPEFRQRALAAARPSAGRYGRLRPRKLLRALVRFIRDAARSLARSLRPVVTSLVHRLTPAEASLRLRALVASGRERRGQAGSVLPAWLVEEMRAIGSIEPDLIPTSADRRQVPIYVPAAALAAPAFARMLGELTERKATHVVLCPWLKRGGADLGVIHHVKALVEDLGRECVLITTEDTDSPWLGRLPAKTGVIEMGKLCRDLPAAVQETCLARLLVQARPEVIHNIQSDLAWRVFRRHGRALASSSRLFSSLFCDDYTPEGKPLGYSRSYLFDCYPLLHGILFDTQAFPRELSATYGYAAERMHTVYFPTERAHAPPLEYRPSARILWAGRLDRQKRPDLLAETAVRCPEIGFDVFGATLVSQDPSHLATLRRLRKLPNVALKGSYDSFAQIARNGYAAFMYTSGWDGLPNTLLEAAAEGLPIVASSVGGITELLDGECSRLVPPAEGAEGFVRGLRELVANPAVAAEVAARAKARIRSQHTWECFVQRLRELPGYDVSESRGDQPALSPDRLSAR